MHVNVLCVVWSPSPQDDETDTITLFSRDCMLLVVPIGLPEFGEIHWYPFATSLSWSCLLCDWMISSLLFTCNIVVLRFPAYVPWKKFSPLGPEVWQCSQRSLSTLVYWYKLLVSRSSFYLAWWVMYEILSRRWSWEHVYLLCLFWSRV